jgi:hypothetical protein
LAGLLLVRSNVLSGVKPRLSVSVASVSDNANVDEACVVVDGVYDAVIADPDSPQIGSSL